MFICMATIRFVKRIFDQRRMERKKAGHQPDLRSSENVVYLSDQNSSDPSVTRRPDDLSKSMILSLEIDILILVPILKWLLPKMTPVSRKSPMRTLIVDSMPVGMAP